MKSRAILLFVLLLGSISCGRESTERAASAPPAAQLALKDQPAEAEPVKSNTKPVKFDKFSLANSEKAETSAAAFDRKIIRNADLTMEVASTTAAQQRAVSIAESHGGFVVTSEAKQRESVEPSKRAMDIKLVLRIPENQFNSALEQIRGLASNLPEEHVTGQDVTEEFIDLEARIKTKTALEQQFLQIMKQAGKIVDALEVQRQIAEVRTEIEQLEGRKRFLQNRASLSTITVNIQSPKPMVAVSTTGFGRTVRDAVSESVDVASEIIVFFVRFVIVMLPVVGFVLLPGGLILRYFMRRAKRMRLAEALSGPSAE